MQPLDITVADLVVIGFYFMVISSIGSILNSVSALPTPDFIKPSRPQPTPRRLAWIGRGAILLFMLLSTVVAPLIGSFEDR